MDKLPITYLEPVLFRNYFEEPWKVGVYAGLHDGQFLSGEEHLYNEIAPLQGNEGSIGRVADAYCLIDLDFLISNGLAKEAKEEVIELQFRTPINMDKDLEELR